MRNTTKINGFFNVPKSFDMLLNKIIPDSNWHSDSNWQTILLSAFCIIYLVIFKELINPWIKKKIKFDFPSELVLVIMATLFSHFIKLKDYGVKTIGTIPNGYVCYHL